METMSTATPTHQLAYEKKYKGKGKGKGKGKTKMPQYLHPNPTPAQHPHPSSIFSLCDYIDDEIIYLRNHYYDDDMEFFREEYSCACPYHSPDPATPPPTRDPSFASSSSEPSPSTTPPIRFQPLDLSICTAGGPFLSPHFYPLVPGQREAIEQFIPATLLRMPLMFRTNALRAWCGYTNLQVDKKAQAALRKRQRGGSRPKLTVLPWDEGAEDWNGTFPREAMEVLRLTGGIGGEGLYRKVPNRLRDGRRKSGVEGKREEGERWLDMSDGHVLGMDWACGKERVMVLHEQRDADEDGDKEKARKDSVLDKMVDVLKRARP
jgi:hypothetical protein